VRLPSFVVTTEIIFAVPRRTADHASRPGETPDPYVAGTLLAIRTVAQRPGLRRRPDSPLLGQAATDYQSSPQPPPVAATTAAPHSRHAADVGGSGHATDSVDDVAEVRCGAASRLLTDVAAERLASLLASGIFEDLSAARTLVGDDNMHM
jgi:hypothetical protein